ncbi:hypothetical protein UFOVP327_30 [uncultured Caudovirales phage]|uniref:Uncharacterized protein n=1 Tax=uncultured Caudovirales phage TaxID=2100421 RepID=A0A6J5LX75_9CAUD|nr:hypothetical protein UFOVP327_30 [uncultured Caudovirales phage]
MIEIRTGFTDQITPGIKRIRDRLTAYPAQAEAEYRRLTPIARVNGGNARRKTKLNGPDRIELDYEYATVLDAGRKPQGGRMRGSQQAPQGMTRPFVKWVGEQMKRIFRI